MSGRIFHFFVVIVAILSVGAASVSACTCSHHETQIRVSEPSCHGHSEAPKTDTSHGKTADDPAREICLRSGGSCVCANSVSKASPKSETVKLQKHKAAAPFSETVCTKLVGTRLLSHDSPFEKPFFLSDSFHDLAPKRGPPAV